MLGASREEVARTVASEPGRLRRAEAVTVLAVLGASALVPVTTAVLGGGAVATAVAGVFGGAGGGYLTDLVQQVATRLRTGKRPPAPGEVRDALAADLRRALDKADSAAGELSTDLMTVLLRVDGIDAAVMAARDDLRAHLRACFTEITSQQLTTLRMLRAMNAEQHRQAALLEDIAEYLRRAGQQAASPAGPAPAGPQAAPIPPAPHLVRPIVVAPGPAASQAEEWAGGADIMVGRREYLLYDGLLEVRPSPEHALIRRQAHAQRIAPPARPGERYAWLRQAEMRRNTAPAAEALAALTREHNLLQTLGAAPGLPPAGQFEPGRTTTLVLVWPASRSTGVACETLDVLCESGGVPLDEWRTSRLCEGLGGLCGTLARLHEQGLAHRTLTPAGIVMLDNGGLVLRDLGLAARDPTPGEGPAGYQAPEQRRRRSGQPGRATDAYQIGAVAYRLITGRLPHPATPLPVRSLAPDLPAGAGGAVDAALAAEPAARPTIRQLGAALRSVRRALPGES